MGRVLSEPYAGLWEGFLTWIQNRVTPQGYGTIRKNVYYLLKWFEEEDVIPHEATIRSANQYKNTLSLSVTTHGKPLSAGTIHNRLKAGRTFFKYLVATEKIETNPFMEIKPPKHGEHFSRNILSEVQMGFLLENLKKFDEADSKRGRLGKYRLHVMAEFLYSTGLRIAEAASLEPKNIDIKGRLVYVAEGKGKKSRLAFMTGYASEVMKLYLERGRQAVFGSYGRLHGGTVFGAHPQRVMAVVNTGLKEACRKLELPEISSHAFRYSLGPHLLKSGCDMRYIQVILGHECLNTTQVYTRVDKDDIKDSLDRFHPRRWGKSCHEVS
jgi:integrase/recombinase XerD